MNSWHISVRLLLTSSPKGLQKPSTRTAEFIEEFLGFPYQHDIWYAHWIGDSVENTSQVKRSWWHVVHGEERRLARMTNKRSMDVDTCWWVHIFTKRLNCEVSDIFNKKQRAFLILSDEIGHLPWFQFVLPCWFDQRHASRRAMSVNIPKLESSTKIERGIGKTFKWMFFNSGEWAVWASQISSDSDGVRSTSANF